MSTLRGKCVVVLGGAGFLGSWLCERLVAEGARAVHALDNLSTGSTENLAALRREPTFEFIQADIVEFASPALHPDFIFNLASPASPRDYDRLWLETMRVGAEGTRRALEWAQAHEAHFIHASTSEVYGDPLVHPQPESYLGNVDVTSPRAVYDESKRYAEALVEAFRVRRGVSTRVARIFNTYGPRQRLDDGRVVTQFIVQALAGAPLTVHGDGSQTRSFCFVDDLIDGLVALALSSETRPVNLGNDEEMTMLACATQVREATHSRSELVFRPLPASDPRQRRPDLSRARTVLQWRPHTPFVRGLAQTVPDIERRLLQDRSLP